MNKTLKSLIILLCLNVANSFAFNETRTHRDLTERAFTEKASGLNSYLITQLGFQSGTDTKFFQKDVLKWLKDGSNNEDIPTCRAANHFHNPLLPWNQSQSTDLWPQDAICQLLGWTPRYSDIVWATGLTSPSATPISRNKQSMGYDDAKNYFYNALTSSDMMARETLFAKSFQAMGQSLHLLQDMAVPAHVRNDFLSHLIYSGINLDNILQPTNWVLNPFEAYVKNNPSLVSSILPSQVPTLAINGAKVSDFWDTNTLATAPFSQGLAESTNAGYFSDFTIPDNPHIPFAQAHTFALPQIPAYTCSDTLPGSTRQRKYASRNPCPTDGSPVDHLAAISMLTPRLIGMPPLPLPFINKYALDPNVHNTYAKELLPRAVGYSAALLDYFFRGRIKLEMTGSDNSNSLVHLKAINETAGNESMSGGEVSLVLRYRLSQMNDQSFSIPEGGDYFYKVKKLSGTYSIPGGAGTDFTFDLSLDPLPDWANDITAQLVYHGQLGNEAGAVAVGSLPIRVSPESILISLPDSGAYAVSNGTVPFKRITLKAGTELPAGLNLPGAVFQLVLIHRYSDGDPYQGIEVATLPENQNSYYAIRANEMNGVNSLAANETKELVFDITATPVPLTAADVHLYLVYKKSDDPDNSALAVGYLDISEPTPIDVYNNTNKVCLNSQWYDAGSAAAMAIADPDNDGFTELTDIFTHNIENIYYQPGSNGSASSSNFLLSSTTPLAPGTGRRLGYLLTDYYFSQSFTETVTDLDSRDTWELSYYDSTIAAEGFVSQHNMGNMQGYSGMYDMAGYKMHGGAGIIYDNYEYPEGANCSWDLLRQAQVP